MSMLIAFGQSLPLSLYLVIVLVCLVHLSRTTLVQLGLLLWCERIEHGLVQCDDRLVHEGGHSHGRPLGVFLANTLRRDRETSQLLFSLPVRCLLLTNLAIAVSRRRWPGPSLAMITPLSCVLLSSSSDEKLTGRM